MQIDWSDPDTLTGLLGGILGLAVGIGAPLFYISRDRADDKKLEELRELNRQTFKETGQYLTEVCASALHGTSGSQQKGMWMPCPSSNAANACAGGDQGVQAATVDRQKVRYLPSCFSIPHSLLQKAALQRSGPRL